tara:strand:+ start:12910 stop:13134 length:225 start_codon:yes stop_codon:yes gene_type:complete
MGNMFIKKSPTHEFINKDLNRILLLDDLIERVTYLENKLDNLDAKIWKVEANSTANLKVMSNDIHLMYERFKKL